MGLVLVTETRTVDLPAGPAAVAFQGVADGMLAQTAAVKGLQGPVVEQNYDYDLLTPGALAAKAVGQTVRVVRTNPATGRRSEERAVVRGAPSGLVLDFGGGRVEALGCSGGPERIVYDRVPAGLATRPTLSVRTVSPRAGRRTVTLSYLALGLAWSADYVLRLKSDGMTADLTGWLTLANGSDTSFGDAPTEVVAGTLSREQVERVQPVLTQLARACWTIGKARGGDAPEIDTYDDEGRYLGIPPPPPPPPPMMAPAPSMESAMADIVVTAQRARRSELGDYKLYTLPEPTTVAARQTKQVAFLTQAAVKLRRVYRLDVITYGNDQAVLRPALRLKLNNTEQGGLGEPLPAGSVAVYQTVGIAPVLAGEDRITDKAVGLPFDLRLGDAMDLTAQVAIERRERAAVDRERQVFAVTLANAKPAAVEVELRAQAQQGLKVTAEDAPHVVQDGVRTWTLPLQPGERRTFRYTLEVDN